MYVFVKYGGACNVWKVLTLSGTHGVASLRGTGLRGRGILSEKRIPIDIGLGLFRKGETRGVLDPLKKNGFVLRLKLVGEEFMCKIARPPIFAFPSGVKVILAISSG